MQISGYYNNGFWTNTDIRVIPINTVYLYYVVIEKTPISSMSGWKYFFCLYVYICVTMSVEIVEYIYTVWMIQLDMLIRNC